MEQLRSARLPSTSTLIAVCLALMLSGCGSSDSTSGGSGSSSGSSGSGGSTQTYTLSGTVGGLRGSGLTHAVNGAAETVSSGASNVALASGLASGTAYLVSVDSRG
jgi:hypothetical protein